MKTKPELPNEIEALLPWYATGRLSAEDRAKVASALEGHDEFSLQMRLIEEDRDATILLNEDLGGPSVAVWDRIAAVVAAEPRRLPLGERLRLWLGAGAPRGRLAWAGAAAAIVIVLAQGAAIVSLLPASHVSSGFQTASAPAGAATGAQAMIAFAPETRVDQFGALLADAHGAIVEGPRSGFFKIRFVDGPLDKPTLDARLAKLRASGLVKMAVPTGSGG